MKYRMRNKLVFALERFKYNQYVKGRHYEHGKFLGKDSKHVWLFATDKTITYVNLRPY